jgi:RNA polymerase sigma-70 factor (ECF subfamily)
MVASPRSEIAEIDAAKLDPRKFEPLYMRYYEQIVRFIYKRVENIDTCRELTSTVFVNAISNLKSYEHKGFPFSSWLYRIAINEVNRYYKQVNTNRLVSVSDRNLNNIIEESGENNKELISVLRKALLYLDPEELNLIELRFFEEQSFAEMGEILEISEGNAKIKTYRALDKLRNIYTKL